MTEPGHSDSTPGAGEGRPQQDGGAAPASAAGDLERPVAAGAVLRLDLGQVAAVLTRLGTADTLDANQVGRLRARSVVPDEDVHLPAGHGACTAGRHFTALGDGVFRAERYGYLSLRGGRVEVVSPLWVDPAGLAACWLVLDEEARAVTADMVLHCLGDRAVVEGISRSAVERVAARVVAGAHQCGAERVAAGRAPDHGQDGVLQFAVSLAAPADGIDAGTPVRTGQVVAHRRAATRGVSGVTVHGVVLPARDGREADLAPGANIHVEPGEGTVALVATTNGALRADGGLLHVVKVLRVRGSVGFDTGSLRFAGQIRIARSVGRGFSVHAEDAVLITGSVEPGALVQARRDVRVQGAVYGSRTRVEAGGSAWVGSVEEATVTAEGDVTVGQQATRARLVAGGMLRADALSGGEAWGCRGVQVGAAGTRTGEATVLAAGMRPEQSEGLDKVLESLNTVYGQLVRHLERFGLTRLDLAQVRDMVSAAAGPRRLLLASTAERLTELVRLYRSLAAGHRQLREQTDAGVRTAVVEVLNQVYAGTTIRLGSVSTRLSLARGGPVRFRVQEGRIDDGALPSGPQQGISGPAAQP